MTEFKKKSELILIRVIYLTHIVLYFNMSTVLKTQQKI